MQRFEIKMSKFESLECLELSQDVTGEMLIDFPVSRDRLAGSGFGILIPVVAPATAQKDAAALLQLPDQVDTFQAMFSSATRRTPGMLPLVSSA